jgi:hypothetical protein
VFLDGARATQEHELADGAICHGQAETLVHQLGETAPR